MNKEILALFSGQAATLTTPKLYVELTGSYSLAIVLNQCVFWSNKSSSKDGFFYKSYEEWFEEIHIPERTLRRRFDFLEKEGWIETKIKKVNGLNIKHVKTHVDKILDSISGILFSNSPSRPHTYSGAGNTLNDTENEQKICTQIAPTGHIGRLEPATLSGSYIYTDNNLQITTTTKTESSSFFTDSKQAQLLAHKIETDTRSDEVFLKNAQHHVEKNSDMTKELYIRVAMLLVLLKKLKKEGEIFKSFGFVDMEDERAKQEKEEKRKLLFEQSQNKQHEMRLSSYQKNKNVPELRPTSQALAGIKKLSEILNRIPYADSRRM